MATKIVTKNSSTGGAVPSASDLVQGELAVNVADKRLFTEDNGGSIVELGTNPSTIDINAGTIDGTAIGASSASTGAFTTLTATGLTVQTAQGDISIPNGTSSFNFARAGTNYIRATDASGAFSFITGANDFATQRLNIANNGDISFYEDTGTTAKLFWDASAERLGIGTTSPSEELELASSSPTIRLTDTNDSTYGSVSYNVNALMLNGDNTIRCSTDGSERMRIDSSGNVGIGTSSPSQMLELSANNGSGVANVLRFNDADTGVTAGQTTGRIEFAENDGGNTTVSAFLEVNTVGTSGGGVMKFGTGIAGATATESMRIDSSGNLLVGKTSADYSDTTRGNVEIEGSSSAILSLTGNNTNGYLFQNGVNMSLWNEGSGYLSFATSNTEAMRIDSSGNLVGGDY